MKEINIKQISVSMMRTNCYVIYNDEGEAVIVDPGDNYTKIKDAIIALKLSPKAILLTHGHFDHIGAASKLKEVYGINIYAYEDEKQVLNSADYNLSNIFGVPIVLEADVYLRDNEEIEIIGFKFKVIHTPGHTVGSCCYYLKEYGMMFTGDTLFAGTHGRYDFPTGNGRHLLESITEKIFSYDDNIDVFPGHNEETTIGSERKWY
jgi:glyoxylase-like metal-dependent hydrolase (beta-lactamase superfamily II)